MYRPFFYIIPYKQKGVPMFRKFQEITFNVYFHDRWPKTFSDLIGIFYVCTLLAEFGSLLYCGSQIYNDGWTRITTPWMVSIIVFWLTFIISIFICECGKTLKGTDYNRLDIESKRYVFKVSIVLFFHLLSCGFMAVILPVAILISIFNSLSDRISRWIFPDKPPRNKDLSDQFNSLIRDIDNGR